MNRRQLLWLSGSISLLLFLAMVVYTRRLQPGIPCLQLTYSESAFKAILERWGATGIVRFRRHFVIDFPVLISYGLFGYLLSRWTTLFAQHSTTFRSLMTWSLPAAAALDAAENLFHLELTSGEVAYPAGLYLVAGLTASGKWLLIATFVIGSGYAWFKTRSTRRP